MLVCLDNNVWMKLSDGPDLESLVQFSEGRK